MYLADFLCCRDVKLIPEKPASPVGVAESQELLFYLEQNTKTIFSISKTPPYSSKKYLENTAERLRAITVFHHGRERPCAYQRDALNIVCMHVLY